MDFIFCKLAKPQKTWISFFASLQNLKKHDFHLLQAKKLLKTTGGPANARAVMYHSGIFDPFYLSTIGEATIQVSRVNTWLGPSALDFETNAHWLSNGLFSVTQGHCVPNPVILSQQEAAAAGIPASDYTGLYNGQTCVN